MVHKQKPSGRITSEKRVEIWNTLFGAAYFEAVKLRRLSHPSQEIPDWKPEGGILNEEDSAKLFHLMFLILAVEARASHLIEECVDKNNISIEQGQSLHQLNFKQEWGLLPIIFRTPQATMVDFDNCPHKVVAELKKLRDDLFHVNYKNLRKTLDKISTENAIQYTVDFWDSMEHMNALLKRGGRTEPDRQVLTKVDALRQSSSSSVV